MLRTGLGSMAAMHAERLGWIQAGWGHGQGYAHWTPPPSALHRPEPHTCSTRRTHSLLCITCIFILCDNTITINVAITRRNTIAVTIIAVIVQRKAHGPQSAPKALAVLLARALNVAVTHAQHVRASLPEQGDDAAQERLARRATGRVRGFQVQLHEAGVRGRNPQSSGRTARCSVQS